MKKSLIYMAALTLAAGFSACDNNFTEPPLADYIPKATLQPNTTVAQLKEAFGKTDVNYSTLIEAREDGTPYIVAGRIISSDASGNMYKKIVIEDETGALIFSVNTNEMYKTYKFGQDIVVDLTGMYYGNYSGGNLVGGYAAATAGPSRMVKSLFTTGAQVNGLPSPAQVDTATVTLDQLAAIRDDAAQFPLWQGKLVRIDGLHFEATGTELGSSSSFNNSRNLLNDKNQKIVLNTCGYGTLWSILAPTGTGSVVGILSNYSPNSGSPSWQINLLDAAGLIGFKPWQEGPAVGSLDVNFESGALPEGWRTYKVKGNKDWYVRDFNGNKYASMSGYNGTAPFDAWMVSQPLDASLLKDKTLTFESMVNGYGSKTTQMEVFILTAQNPAAANQTKLQATWAQAPASGYSQWVSSGTIDLSGVKGKFYIGWRYTATVDANYATWCIDNIKVQ